MLRCTLLALVFCVIALVGLGQDPFKRMDPDEWLALNDVQTMVQWTEAKEGAFWSEVWSDVGALRTPCSADPKWTLRNGDLRVVLTAGHENISRSHNLGFNVGAKSVVFNERLLSLGGRGYWNGHSKLIEFVEKSGEWEWVMTEEEGPECVIRTSSWFNSATGQVFSLDEGQWGRSNETGRTEVWCLDVASSSWDRVGRVNPKMELFVHGSGKLIDLEDYFVWPGMHKSAIVRKKDLQTVLTTAWNDAEHKDVLRETKKQSMRMTLAAEGLYRILSLNDEGQETVWLEWDVEAAFVEAWGRGESSPWLVPLEDEEMIIETRVAEDAEANMPAALWAVVVLMVAGVAFGAGRRGIERRGEDPQATQARQEPAVARTSEGGHPKVRAIRLPRPFWPSYRTWRRPVDASCPPKS